MSSPSGGCKTWVLTVNHHGGGGVTLLQSLQVAKFMVFGRLHHNMVKPLTVSQTMSVQDAPSVGEDLGQYKS